jgi:hypothetical protein
MKKVLLFSFILSFLFACESSKPPKEVAQEFIKAAYSGDNATASSLATEKTKANISQTKAEATGMTAEESFSLATLRETVTGSTAEVKNDLIKLSLEKESEGWKVAATPEVVTAISNRQSSLTTLKQKWETLLNEYEGRLNVAKEYVSYKKNQGSTSQQIKTLNEMISTLSVKTTWDKNKILLYVQKQKQFQNLIVKALEPSQNANSDMSMNYFIQVSNADSRIKTAMTEYQALAEKTPSATYPTLSEKEVGSMN